MAASEFGKSEFDDYNYYKALGIPENATDEQIDKAYKNLVQIFHSDKTGKGDLAVKFANRAREVLKNQELRRSHDSFIHTTSTNSSANNHNIDTLTKLLNKAKQTHENQKNTILNLKRDLSEKIIQISELENKVYNLNNTNQSDTYQNNNDYEKRIERLVDDLCLSNTRAINYKNEIDRLKNDLREKEQEVKRAEQLLSILKNNALLQKKRIDELRQNIEQKKENVSQNETRTTNDGRLENNINVTKDKNISNNSQWDGCLLASGTILLIVAGVLLLVGAPALIGVPFLVVGLIFVSIWDKNKE